MFRLALWIGAAYVALRGAIAGAVGVSRWWHHDTPHARRERAERATLDIPDPPYED